MKKQFLRLILVGVILFLVYIGLQVYQSNHIEIISFEDMSDLQVSTPEGISEDTVMIGTAEVESFESVALTDKVVVDNTLYLIIYKWPTFVSEDEIDISLNQVAGLNQVDKVSVVWGAIYSEEGNSRGYSYGDLVDHPEQELIWEKEEGLDD